MSAYNKTGFVTAGPGDHCDRAPVVIDYEASQRIQQTIARTLALGPRAPFVCESETHPRFVTEQQALEPHVCPICGGPMKRERTPS